MHFLKYFSKMGTLILFVMKMYLCVLCILSVCLPSESFVLRKSAPCRVLVQKVVLRLSFNCLFEDDVKKTC